MTIHICQEPELETWRPDFSSSGQEDPIWNRVRCHRHVIANSLEWVEWTDNPVQVILCEACGTNGCASGGYVHVSRLGDYVLFTSPQASHTDLPEGVVEPPLFLSTLGAVAIRAATWNGWSTRVPGLVAAERLEPANHAAVADAWLLGRARRSETLLNYLEENLLAGDTLDRRTLIDLVSNTLERFAAKAAVPFNEPILSLQETGARLETLYFDGPAELDWPAFAFNGDRGYVALDGERVTALE